MKKNNIVFPALFLTLTAMPTYTFALTASGTVVDASNEPLINVTVTPIDSAGNRGNPVIGDLDGNFKLDIKEGSKLEISYMTKKKIIDNPTENLKVILADEGQKLKEVVATKEHQEGDTCGERLITDEHANKSAKGKYHKVGNEWICIPNDCIQDYIVEENVCVKYQCSKEDLNIANAKNGAWDKSTQKCIPTCDEDGGYTKSPQNICEKTNCSKSEIANLKKDKNVDTGKLEGGQCVPVCKDKYHPVNGKCVENKCEKDEEDWDGTKCVKVKCTNAEKQAIHAKEGKWENNQCVPTACDEKVYTLKDGVCDLIDKRSDEEKKKALEEKQKAYDDAKAKEQSIENRTLTAASVAATGIGGMQALQGMAEQSADKDAMADMAAYIETMRCTYGDGKQVKAGPDEIELPGANDQELMNLRTEYLALAQDLKERKAALGMKPGIESETILDRTQTGLYDDENVGITSGNYESIYRAMMLGSESDQAKLDEQKNTSSNRVKYGAIAAGAGVVGGIAGNSLINGKLGELLKSKKADKNDANKEEVKVLEQEVKSLDELKKCLKDAGIKDTDNLGFKNFYPSVLSVKNIDCKSLKIKEQKVKASDIFADSNDENEIFTRMDRYFDMETISKFVGFSNEESADTIRAKIKSSMSERQKKIDEAKKKDAESNSKKSKSSNDLDDALGNIDLSNIVGQAGNLLGGGAQ